MKNHLIDFVFEVVTSVVSVPLIIIAIVFIVGSSGMIAAKLLQFIAKWLGFV